jgi:ABC-type Fe3+/spermidine/putrescine transport system ATPase subunit
MAFFQIENLVKEFGAFRAVDNISIEVGQGQVCTLLGPSGCGKTTTLRCVAGLETFEGGRITIGGQVMAEPERGIFVAPERRDLGMMFQSYALWPHKTVGENVALGLRIKGLPRGEIRDRVSGMLELVGMPGSEDRYPGSMSGGQQQRVSLARALALQPKCLLFDEPLSNLDLLLRERMRFEIRSLLEKLAITAIYVTHDQSEAMVLSDHIIVMNRGRIEQQGAPQDIYLAPKTRFTAEFLGRTNILPLDRQASDPDKGVVAAGGGLRFVSASAERLRDTTTPMLVAFRPEMVRSGVEAAGMTNRFEARVLSMSFLGANTHLEVELFGHVVAVSLPGLHPYSKGDLVPLAIDAASVLVIADDAHEPSVPH